MQDSHATIQPGTVLLGRYRVEHVLGQGGMGIVVAARHVNLGELFAVKLLLPAAVEKPQAVERFLREARAAARLKSEHVAKVVDVGTLESGAPYMVMEHLSGVDLRELLRQRGPLPIDEAVTYVVQACDAVAEAHSHGIVHRDLKPANLFVIRRPNGSPCIKVLDFGISKQLGEENVDLTSTQTSVGSPLYMSPEQMTRAKSVDTRTDIWSMGVVLYELVTGITPFPGETLTEVVGRVLQEEPTRPLQMRPDLPPWVESAIMGCLQKPREQRFQSVRDLVNVLTAREPAAIVPPRPPHLAPPHAPPAHAPYPPPAHAPYPPPPAAPYPAPQAGYPSAPQAGYSSAPAITGSQLGTATSREGWPSAEMRPAQTHSTWEGEQAPPRRKNLGLIVGIAAVALVAASAVLVLRPWAKASGSGAEGAAPAKTEAAPPSAKTEASSPAVTVVPSGSATAAPQGASAAPAGSPSPAEPIPTSKPSAAPAKPSAASAKPSAAASAKPSAGSAPPPSSLLGRD